MKTNNEEIPCGFGRATCTLPHDGRNRHGNDGEVVWRTVVALVDSRDLSSRYIVIAAAPLFMASLALTRYGS